MKKYKAYWSIFNLFNDTQKEITKLQGIWATIAAAATTSTWAMTNDSYALYVAMGAAVIDKIIACIYLEEIKDASNKVS